MEYYLQTPEQVLKEIGSSNQGLSKAEAIRRKEQYGPNELQKEKGDSAIKLFLEQFKNMLMILLIIAMLISLALGEFVDACAMFAILMLSAGLGFFQEYRAEKAIEALKQVASPNAKVIREGVVQEIAASSLVPGDIILLEEGVIVPADARIIEAMHLEINESSLTGESVPSQKRIEALKEQCQIVDQKNMAFMGSAISYGKGKGIVVETGMKTQLGKIAKTLSETEEPQTPLQIKFEKMAKQIGYAVLVLVTIVFVTGVFAHNSGIAELFIFVLSLAVAAVPSSLPAIVTIGLSMGAKRLAKQNMIIKSLPATESLGSATLICSDKTGTLTKNEMTITKIFANLEEVDVSGSGYSPEGELFVGRTQANIGKLSKLFAIGTLCNNAEYQKEGRTWQMIGDPTEGSLLVLATKAGESISAIKKENQFVSELPFDSDRKMMSVIVDSSKREAFVKGAPDIILKKCSHYLLNGTVKRLSDDVRKQILDRNDTYAKSALRVLGLAYRPISKQKEYNVEDVEKDLIFTGLVGMIDPPREGVREAIAKCKDAGIKVMVITGDHALTAKAIAEKIGLFEEGDVILTGKEIENLSEKELEEKIKNVRIIARALPIQKSRIVDALKKQGHVVAMTGDGVNDAPALKKADIGIAMGISGTDVAKEVSKGILVDDHFATIVNAISEGRNIYDKIIKSTRYLLSCNAGEICAVFFAVIFRLPLPLLPLQILLMNLLTDGLPALGLSTEPSEEHAMQRPPRDPKENPLNKSVLANIVIFGAIMGLGTLYVFWHSLPTGETYAQTMAFTTLVAYQMFAVFGSRSLEPFSLKHLNPFSNMWLLVSIISSILIQVAVVYVPFLQTVFGTTALGMIDILLILGISSSGFVVMEIGKYFIHTSKVL